MKYETDCSITGFGKHFSTMYQGSMVGSGAIVFALMGYVISNQAPVGEELLVELNPKLLGFILGEEEAKVEQAIEFLCKADPNSRSKEESGKRLVRVGQFAYRVVNGRKYREMAKAERRKVLNREAKRRERAKTGSSGTYAERLKEKAMGDGDEGTVRRLEEMEDGVQPGSYT